MKKAIFTFFIATVFICNISAQDNGSKEEVEVDALRKEMQDKMDVMKAEMETAMKDMQIMMQDMQMNNADGKNEIIINGDTIIIAPGDALPENLADVFKQLPENVEGMDFFFGGSEFDDLFGMMKEFQGDIFNMDNLENFIPPMNKEKEEEDKEEKKAEEKKDKKTPKKVEKKRKTYSL